MMNRKKRKKMNNRRNPGIPHESVQIRYSRKTHIIYNAKILTLLQHIYRRPHCREFQQRDPGKMPLVVFGDVLKNRFQVKFRGLRHGLNEKIYKRLIQKEKQGQLLPVDINEFNTSKVCSIQIGRASCRERV